MPISWVKSTGRWRPFERRDRLDELQALAEENISADQISQVAGAIQEQGANLDLGSIAEQAGLPADIISQISGLLGK